MSRVYCVPDFVLGVAKGAASASAVTVAADICAVVSSGVRRSQKSWGATPADETPNTRVRRYRPLPFTTYTLAR